MRNCVNRRVFVYMPTYRGSAGRGGTRTSELYLNYHLTELDRRLRSDELLFLKLHPLAADKVDMSGFEKIKSIPERLELYEFLCAADVLVTDYSSVMFDFALSGKKTVLFTYDREEYEKTRGAYLSLDSLPFPKVDNINELLLELRSEKKYDDREFLAKFCPYDGIGATSRLCDAVILGERGNIRIEPTKDNGKENVLIYAGNLAKNGITTSLLSLLSTVDTKKRNYYITYKNEKISKNRAVLKRLPEGVGYVGATGDIALSISERCVRWLFKKKLLSAKIYARLCKRVLSRGFEQYFGDARINSVIQFNGYESELLLLFSAFSGQRTVFVHNDMEKEIKIKENQRRDVLRYIYRKYTAVAVVTEDIAESVARISGRRDNIRVVKNAINPKSVIEKSKLPIGGKPFERCTVSRSRLLELLASNGKKIISIGRFSPEKAHGRLVSAFEKFLQRGGDAYLLIIGGYNFAGYYERLVSQIEAAGISERVIPILGVTNPYNILASCDGFILGSLYEGFGLVIAEADILGLPVVSTDIDGPRGFMRRYGGRLVESSPEGILEGLELLAEGKIAPLAVDYESYNDEVRQEFEALFGRGDK